MLTQKLLAHLPLLLHPNPREVAIVGLGSGVTLASALVHSIESVDVIELSPEVQKATKEMSVKWAEEQAKTNPWFKKVWESQREFEKLWENASSYRNVKY